MPVDVLVVGINPAVMPFTKKAFTFGDIKVISCLPLSVILCSFLEAHVFLRQVVTLFLFGFIVAVKSELVPSLDAELLFHSI